jgi:hypothetical protein
MRIGKAQRKDQSPAAPRPEGGQMLDSLEGTSNPRLRRDRERTYEWQFWRASGEWRYLRNGRLGFSCAFLRGDGRVDCVSSVDEAV